MTFEGLVKKADYDISYPSPNVHNPTPAPAPKLGPVERKFDSWAKRILGAGSDTYKHYTANRNLWNIAVPTVGLGATALLANAAQNAFSGNNNQQGGGNGGSSPWSWLLPLGIVGGGLWAWNKYGDQFKQFGRDVTNTMRDTRALVGNLNKKVQEFDPNKAAEAHGRAAGEAVVDRATQKIKGEVQKTKQAVVDAGKKVMQVGNTVHKYAVPMWMDPVGHIIRNVVSK